MVTTTYIGGDPQEEARAELVRTTMQGLGLTSRDRMYGGTHIGSLHYMNPEHTNQALWIPTYDPTTGKELACVEPTASRDYRTVVDAAEIAFNAWRQMPAPLRGDVIRELGNAFREKKEALARLITIEMGKILVESRGEVEEMIGICDYAAGLSRQPFGRVMFSERPQHRMFEQWHPIGPVGVITAFNFPGAVWAWNAAIAAVCGNTIVWKGSDLTPFVSIAVQKICARVMEKCGTPGVFNLVTGGAELGRMMAHDSKLPLVSFTGSCKAGREVAQIVAGRFGKCLLELGGNNAIIVHKDADLDLAARAIVFGATGTNGQRCTTTRRLVVHQDVAHELLHKRLIPAYGQIKIGDPLAEGTRMGPLITSESVRRMEQAIAQAVSQSGGLDLLESGNASVSIGGQFVRPIIIVMPNRHADIVKQETFAPILYMMTYKEIHEAIAINNDVPQGLSSAIFTENFKVAERFLSVIGSDCGIANVNIGTSGAEIGGAFGGEKATGGGREAGSDSWKAYMRRQTCTSNWGDDLPHAQGIKFD